ncbi:hypothetical protein [uncultured Arcticibacterium sp.]|uniref:hypothetical protein n=1 Tax=uncultured Arcticibacterium sp. TaxID=2173042 RepID=UPI0030F8922C
MKTNKKRVLPIQWNESTFYFLTLVVLVLLGFWPTYFAKFLNGTADFSFYFHFHAAMAATWVALLVLQPMLIKNKKVALHRKLGKLTYVLLPLFFLSVILLKHHSIGGEVSPSLGASLWLQLKDLVIIGIMYGIAIWHKKNIQIHARAMIATGIVFIEPSLGRLIINVFYPADFTTGFIVTIVIVYALLLILIFLERKQSKGRWIFPLVGVLYILFHWLYLFGISFPAWDAFASWFALLPLT